MNKLTPSGNCLLKSLDNASSNQPIKLFKSTKSIKELNNNTFGYHDNLQFTVQFHFPPPPGFNKCKKKFTFLLFFSFFFGAGFLWTLLRLCDNFINYNWQARGLLENNYLLINSTNFNCSNNSLLFRGKGKYIYIILAPKVLETSFFHSLALKL